MRSPAEMRGRWIELGERIKADPKDLDAWAEMLNMGRIECTYQVGELPYYRVVLDEGESR